MQLLLSLPPMVAIDGGPCFSARKFVAGNSSSICMPYGMNRTLKLSFKYQYIFMYKYL